MSAVIENALRTLELAGPLLNREEYLNYVSTTLKGIDPTFDKVVTEESMKEYLEFLKEKLNQGIGNDDY
jgi:hypothetical protein